MANRLKKLSGEYKASCMDQTYIQKFYACKECSYSGLHILFNDHTDSLIPNFHEWQEENNNNGCFFWIESCFFLFFTIINDWKQLFATLGRKPKRSYRDSSKLEFRKSFTKKNCPSCTFCSKIIQIPLYRIFTSVERKIIMDAFFEFGQRHIFLKFSSCPWNYRGSVW